MDNSKRRKMLGDAIRDERLSQDLSQRQLAQMTGHSSHSYIVDVEHGSISVGFDAICNIADALDVKVSYFFTKF